MRDRCAGRRRVRWWQRRETLKGKHVDWGGMKGTGTFHKEYRREMASFTTTSRILWGLTENIGNRSWTASISVSNCIQHCVAVCITAAQRSKVIYLTEPKLTQTNKAVQKTLIWIILLTVMSFWKIMIQMTYYFPHHCCLSFLISHCSHLSLFQYIFMHK